MSSKQQRLIVPARLQRQESTGVKLSSADRLKQLENSFRAVVSVESKLWNGKVYKRCFDGREAVQRLVQSRIAESDAKAIEMGQNLYDNGLLEHVTGEHNFENAKYFYRFSSDCREFHPKAIFMGWMAKEGGKISITFKKEFKLRFCVLTPPNKFSYYDKMENSVAKGSFHLSHESIVEEAIRKQDKQGKSQWEFSVTPEKRKFIFRVRSGEIGSLWTSKLREVIASIPADFVDSQGSTEFNRVRDIHNQIQNLSGQLGAMQDEEPEKRTQQFSIQRKRIIDEELKKLKREQEKLKSRIAKSGRRSNFFEDLKNDFDEDQPQNIAVGVASGLKGFANSTFKAVTGVVMKPVEVISIFSIYPRF